MDLETLAGKAIDSVTVGRAFGPAYEHDGCLVIPVAWVMGGGGFGDSPGAAGTGSGGGFITWPLGVYVVKDGNVRWQPSVDATRVALAGLSLVRAVVKLRTLRRVRRHA